MDGRSATLHSVTVSFDGLFIIVRDLADGRELARWVLSEVRANALQERDIVHLQTTADPDALLTLQGAATIAELTQLGIATSGLPRGFRNRLALAAGCIAGIAALSTLVWIFIQPLSKAIAHRIPLEVERSAVGGVEQRLSSSYCESDAAIDALAELATRLLGESHELPPIHILNLEIPNAFAFPGGTVVLTRGLTELAEGPDEVAGVLAHELEHVRQRHVMAGVVRGALLSTLWAVSVGDYTGMMVIDPSTAFQIATLKFSREDEAEADRGAVEMLTRAEIGTDGLAKFFERLGSGEGGDVPEWLSSHPPSKRRAEAASQVIQTHRAIRPALSPEKWQAIKQACEDAPAPKVSLRDLFL